MLDYRSGLLPEQLKEVYREHQEAIYWQQIRGNVAGLAVAQNLTDKHIQNHLGQDLERALTYQFKNTESEFWQSYQRACSRYRFL